MTRRSRHLLSLGCFAVSLAACSSDSHRPSTTPCVDARCSEILDALPIDSLPAQPSGNVLTPVPARMLGAHDIEVEVPSEQPCGDLAFVISRWNEPAPQLTKTGDTYHFTDLAYGVLVRRDDLHTPIGAVERPAIWTFDEGPDKHAAKVNIDKQIIFGTGSDVTQLVPNDYPRASSILLLAGDGPTCHLDGEAVIAPMTSTEVSSASTTDGQSAVETVTTHLEFPSNQVMAGAELHGTLVVENNTGAAIDIMDRGCEPKWAVVLTNGDHPPQMAFTMECVATVGGHPVPPGRTEFPVTVRATLSECTQDPSNTVIPACGPGSNMPSLPVGDYQAVFVGALPGLPLPAPVPIRVVES